MGKARDRSGAYYATLCYSGCMDATIRNLDEATFRALKARAALSGKTMGEMVNEALRAYLGRPEASFKRRSLRELVPEAYPEGNEDLSERIDHVVYGL
jgi:plasmid stability protein